MIYTSHGLMTAADLEEYRQDAVMAIVRFVTSGYAATTREYRERAEQAEAATERVRRMAQVWVDIRPTHPTTTRDGHVMAVAGQQVIAALDHPTDTTGGTDD